MIIGAAAGGLIARLDPPRWWLAPVAALLTAGLIAVTWPALGASYVGLPVPLARLGDVAAIVVAVAVGAAVLAVLLPLTAAGETRSQGGGPHLVERRTVLVAAAGGLLAAATGALAVRLFRAGAFAYDGTRLLAVPREPVINANDNVRAAVAVGCSAKNAQLPIRQLSSPPSPRLTLE